VDRDVKRFLIWWLNQNLGLEEGLKEWARRQRLSEEKVRELRRKVKTTLEGMDELLRRWGEKAFAKRKEGPTTYGDVHVKLVALETLVRLSNLKPSAKRMYLRRIQELETQIMKEAINRSLREKA